MQVGRSPLARSVCVSSSSSSFLIFLQLTEMHKTLHVLDEFLAKLEGRKQGE